jgi:AAA+ superfamily predicted ATPase
LVAPSVDGEPIEVRLTNHDDLANVVFVLPSPGVPQPSELGDDAAFSRRIETIIEFALPSPEERRSLWLTHLGEHHSLTPLELNQVAALVELGGGNIRNVVLAAAVLARAAARPIGAPELLQGLAAEYRKLGQPLPSALAFNS